MTKRDELIEEYLKLFEERGVTEHTKNSIVTFIALVEWYELRDMTRELFQNLYNEFLENE